MNIIKTWIPFCGLDLVGMHNDSLENEGLGQVEPGPIEGLPVELICEIFRFLRPHECVKVGRVCRQWSIAGSADPGCTIPVWQTYAELAIFGRIFPNVSVINEEVWGWCFGDLGASGLSFESHTDVKLRFLKESLYDPESGFDDNKKARIRGLIEKYKGEKTANTYKNLHKRIRVLSEMSRRVKVESQAAGEAPKITWIKVPEGVSYNGLVEGLQAPANGQAVPFRYIWARIATELGTNTVESPYEFAITDAPLEDSRDLPYVEQEQLVGSQGGEVPRLLEYLMLIGFTYMRTPPRTPPTRLFSNDTRETYGRTKERVDGYHLVVGGFAPGGLSVHGDDAGVDECIGVAGCWKF